MKIDKYGNKLYRIKEKIYLFIKSDNRKRTIGKVINNVFNTSRNYDRHLHYKSNSFGFNHALLEMLKGKNIILKTNKREKFIIPVDDIFEKGHYLHFAQQGFEKQIFFKIDYLQAYKNK